MRTFVLVFCLSLFTAGYCFSQSAGSTLYVSVRSVELKRTPSTFANVVAQANFGDAVVVLNNSGKWVEVRTANNNTGWTLLDGLRARRVTATGATATVSEVALAGKGFSAEVEVEYRRNGLDYSAVDAMEGTRTPIMALLNFIIEGRLSRGE
ncbi:MAG: SH3 domain-containing protein [Treponema sp.]|nr:SH3 domain-containing protein [Treponema sp.]